MKYKLTKSIRDTQEILSREINFKNVQFQKITKI